MRARVVGLGQRLAGDDGVGPAVLDELRRTGVPPEVELCEATDATALLTLLETPCPVFVVDALVGPGRMGDVVDLPAEEVVAANDRPLSTHGLGVAAVIGLAGLLFGQRASAHVRIVGVRIALPQRGNTGMSPAVSAGVTRAARALLAHVRSAPAVSRRMRRWPRRRPGEPTR